jgi:hypothetical protein
MREAYLIIQTGYEGIESLDFLTTKSALAIQKLGHIHEKIENDNERDPEWCLDENNFIAKLHSIQGKKDFYCIQKWNGKKFDCVCSKLGISPSTLMLR